LDWHHYQYVNHDDYDDYDDYDAKLEPEHIRIVITILKCFQLAKQYSIKLR
jgi:hypothetical protein